MPKRQTKPRINLVMSQQEREALEAAKKETGVGMTGLLGMLVRLFLPDLVKRLTKKE